jgi:hypothetical protein
MPVASRTELETCTGHGVFAFVPRAAEPRGGSAGKRLQPPEPAPRDSSARIAHRSIAGRAHTARTLSPDARNQAAHKRRSDTPRRPEHPIRQILDRCRASSDTFTVARPRGTPESSDYDSGLSLFGDHHVVAPLIAPGPIGRGVLALRRAKRQNHADLESRLQGQPDSLLEGRRPRWLPEMPWAPEALSSSSLTQRWIRQASLLER